MFTDAILLTSYAVTVKLKYNIQHFLQLSNFDVFWGGLTVFQLNHLYFFAEFIRRAHQLLHLLIDLSLFFAKGCQLMVIGMHYFSLYWLSHRRLFLGDQLKIRRLELFWKVDHALLVDVCQIEQRVAVDETLIVPCVSVRQEKTHDIVLDEIERDDRSEGCLLSEGVEANWGLSIFFSGE